MKKIGLLFLTIILSVVVVGCSSSQSGSSQSESGENEKNEEVIKARFAHNMPVGHHIAKGAEKFAELMEERTDGRVQITVYPSGQLYDDATGIDAVRKGTVELFTNTLSKWGGILPTGEIFSIPGIFTDAKLTYKIIDNGLGDMIAEDMRKIGVENLFLADYGFSYASSMSEPFLGQESFEGKTVRVTNVSAGIFVEELGGAPTTMSGSEVPQALARGTIDGAFSGVTSFNSRKYDDFSKNFTGPFYTAPYAFAANKEWYDSLPEDIKKVMQEVSEEVKTFVRKERQKAEETAMQELESRGMKYVEADEDVKEEWLKASEAVIEEWLKRAGERGQEELDFAYKYLK